MWESELLHPNGTIYYRSLYAEDERPVGPLPVSRDGRFFLNDMNHVEPPWIFRVRHNQEGWFVVDWRDAPEETL